MENRRNYYRILQVQPGAPVEIIRASYRTLMQRLRAHPDRGGDQWNAALINEAYAVLMDPAKRAAYDGDFQARVQESRSAADHAAYAGQPAQGAPAGEPTRCLFCGTAHETRTGRRRIATCSVCDSPLGRATRRRLAADGRRVINRLPRHHPLTLYTTWPQAMGFAGESRDLSLNGISFVTAELLPPHAIVKLDSDVCRAVIQVTNTRVENDGAGGLWLVGAEFLSVLFTRTRGALLSTRA